MITLSNTLKRSLFGLYCPWKELDDHADPLNLSFRCSLSLFSLYCTDIWCSHYTINFFLGYEPGTILGWFLTGLCSGTGRNNWYQGSGLLPCWEGLVQMLRYFNFCIEFFLPFLNPEMWFSLFCCPNTALRVVTCDHDERRNSCWSLVNCTFRRHCTASETSIVAWYLASKTYLESDGLALEHIWEDKGPVLI
jgi:hypothetical protein